MPCRSSLVQIRPKGAIWSGDRGSLSYRGQHLHKQLINPLYIVELCARDQAKHHPGPERGRLDYLWPSINLYDPLLISMLLLIMLTVKGEELSGLSRLGIAGYLTYGTTASACA